MKMYWKMLTLAVAIALSAYGCAGSSATPSGGGDTPVAVEIPMVVPTSISVGASLTSGDISSVRKSMAPNYSSSTIKAEMTAVESTRAQTFGVVDDSLAAVFSGIQFKSSTAIHSGFLKKTDGSVLCFDYKAFTFTPFSVTDPVGIFANTTTSPTCSGNDADPTSNNGKAICMRVWLLPSGTVSASSETPCSETLDGTTDYRLMEAVFTVKPTADSNGKGASHTKSAQLSDTNMGFSYSESDTSNELVFLNINAPQSAKLEHECTGCRFFSNAIVDSRGTLNLEGIASYRGTESLQHTRGYEAALMSAHFYDLGTYLLANIKDTNTVENEELWLENACINRSTGALDDTGAQCSVITPITETFYTPAVPADYQFQSDFFIQPPAGIDPAGNATQ